MSRYPAFEGYIERSRCAPERRCRSSDAVPRHAGFGNETDEEGAHASSTEYRRGGGTLVDTADVYTDGVSEEIIGPVAGRRPGEVDGQGSSGTTTEPLRDRGQEPNRRVLRPTPHRPRQLRGVRPRSGRRWTTSSELLRAARQVRRLDHAHGDDPGWPATILRSLDDVAALKETDGGPISVHGSATLARTLSDAGLIDRYHLLVFPVLLGAGKRLFSDTDKDEDDAERGRARVLRQRSAEARPGRGALKGGVLSPAARRGAGAARSGSRRPSRRPAAPRRRPRRPGGPPPPPTISVPS